MAAVAYSHRMPGADGFPGEPPSQHMRKRARSNAAVTCGSCRNFDGHAWCRRWNFHTDAVSPICDDYRAAPPPTLAGDIPALSESE
jgi:hypothetical protein